MIKKSRYFHLFFLGYFFFCSLIATAQGEEGRLIDSLKTINKIESNKENIVKNNNQIAYLFGSINIDSSLSYSSKAMGIAKRINYRKGLAVSYSYTARGMIEKGNFNAAIENFNNSLELFIEEKDSVNILDCYTGLSYVASYGSSQLKSLDYNLKALNYAEHLKDTANMSVAYNNIGTIYLKLDNYKSSLYYFTKSLNIELSKANSSYSDLAVSYSNIGVLKVENNKFKEAEEDYINLKKVLPKIESVYLKSYLFLSLSGYYTGVKDFDIAKKYIDSATVISEEYNFKQIKSRTYRKKAEWYYYQNLYKESIQYFNKCLEYSKSIEVYEEFPEIYKKLAVAFSKLGFHEKAFYSLQKADASIDSLKNNSIEIFLKEFEEQKAKNELEKNRIEQALKDQQVENASMKMKLNFGYAIAAIILLLLTIGIVAYYFNKSRKSNSVLQSQHSVINEQKLQLQNSLKKLELSEGNLQKLNATKDKFFSIIAHDLKSPFNAILGFSQLLSENYDDFDNNRRKKMIDIIEKTSKSTLYLLENLLTWARSQSGFINIEKKNYNLKKLIKEGIEANLGTAKIKNINVVNSISEHLNVLVDKETMKIVIANLFSNAIKFSNEGSEILLSSKVNKNYVEICFEDSGIGMNKEILEGLFKVEKNIQRDGTSNEKGTGLGLILCKEFVVKNDGDIWVESIEGEGSKFCFSIPLNVQ